MTLNATMKYRSCNSNYDNDVRKLKKTLLMGLVFDEPSSEYTWWVQFGSQETYLMSSNLADINNELVRHENTVGKYTYIPERLRYKQKAVMASEMMRKYLVNWQLTIVFIVLVIFHFRDSIYFSKLLGKLRLCANHLAIDWFLDE